MIETDAKAAWALLTSGSGEATLRAAAPLGRPRAATPLASPAPKGRPVHAEHAVDDQHLAGAHTAPWRHCVLPGHLWSEAWPANAAEVSTCRLHVRQRSDNGHRQVWWPAVNQPVPFRFHGLR